MTPIYLDNNATTPVDPCVRDAMLPFLADRCGNPSSPHLFGHAARNAIVHARAAVARLINAAPARIVFTGSGSEADNLAILGVAFANPEKRHILASRIEHPAVIRPCAFLQRQGWRITWLDADAHGVIRPERLAAALDDQAALVSIMLANNETGGIQPIAELAALAHRQGALFHADAVQAAGRIPIDIAALDVDLLSLSAHKMHGPKGIGALYIRKDVAIEPLIHGGGQEHGLRSGTENVPGIVGFGRAAEIAAESLPSMPAVAALRDRLDEGILRIAPGSEINAKAAPRLPNTASITLPGLRADAVVKHLSRRGIATSAASACKASSPAPSSALLAMGLNEAQAMCTLRLSLSRMTTPEEIDRTLDELRALLAHPPRSLHYLACECTLPE